VQTVVLMLTVNVLSVIILSAVTLSVVMLIFVTLGVVRMGIALPVGLALQWHPVPDNRQCKCRLIVCRLQSINQKFLQIKPKVISEVNEE